MIEAYDFGKMTINGTEYREDVLIWQNTVRCPWIREKGHLLQSRDIFPLLHEEMPEVFVVGIGRFGVMRISYEFRKKCQEMDIRLLSNRTDKAVDFFNNFINDCVKTLGAFHLTC